MHNWGGQVLKANDEVKTTAQTHESVQTLLTCVSRKQLVRTGSVKTDHRDHPCFTQLPGQVVSGSFCVNFGLDLCGKGTAEAAPRSPSSPDELLEDTGVAEANREVFCFVCFYNISQSPVVFLILV